MEWLRLYSGIVDDPKVMLISETLRWRYVALLCVASEEKKNGALPVDKIVAFKLRISEEDWKRTKQELEQYGLIKYDENYNLVIDRWSTLFASFDNLRPSPATWKIIRATVFERDDYTCQYCGKRGVRLECDHILAISRGGSNKIENLATACFDCNRSKRAKTIEEWRQS